MGSAVITVHDLVPASAHVTLAMVDAYLRRTDWAGESRSMALVPTTVWTRGPDAMATCEDADLAELIRLLALVEQRQPSAVMADIVGYAVGLSVGTAMVNLNSAMACAVEGRQRLAGAERALKAKPSDEDRQMALATAQDACARLDAAVERARLALACAEAAPKPSPPRVPVAMPLPGPILDADGWEELRPDWWHRGDVRLSRIDGAWWMQRRYAKQVGPFESLERAKGAAYE
jgi:hypothetical protein